MGRPTRKHFPSSIHHVVLKGNDSQKVFFEKKDKNKFFDLLDDGMEKHQYRLLGYCLMSNHIHLAIQVGKTSISEVIHNLSSRYTRYINREYEKEGHLFQGRFWSRTVKNALHLITLIRYIHLNPVKAKIVTCPTKYNWCSHNEYIQSEGWASPDFVLKVFDNKKTTAIQKYLHFIAQGLGNDDEEFLMDRSDKESPTEFNEDKFLKDLNRSLQIKQLSPSEFLEKAALLLNINFEDLSSSKRTSEIVYARSVLSHFVKKSGYFSLRDLAKALQRNQGGLSKLAIQFEKSKISENTVSILNDLQNLFHK